MLVDSRGLEFKVGCKFKDPDWCEMEVLKIQGDVLICMGYVPGYYDRDMFKAPRILHYRELAPDKRGFMICEGDRANAEWIENLEVLDYIDSRFILKNLMGRIFACPQVTFVSRPTEPDKKKAEIQEQIKKLEADVAELKRKAEVM